MYIYLYPERERQIEEIIDKTTKNIQGFINWDLKCVGHFTFNVEKIVFDLSNEFQKSLIGSTAVKNLIYKVLDCIKVKLLAFSSVNTLILSICLVVLLTEYLLMFFKMYIEKLA